MRFVTYRARGATQDRAGVLEDGLQDPFSKLLPAGYVPDLGRREPWEWHAEDVLLVPPNSPFRSVKELIDYAKAHPGELNYASLGTGTSGHLATVMFSELAGIKLQHVPYTSVSQATTDVISGRIAVFLPTLGGHLGNVAAGRMRARPSMAGCIRYAASMPGHTAAA